MAVVLIGCSTFWGNDNPGKFSLDELLDAPESISVGDQTLRLRTYMWRDFMPISPPDGKPLIAIFWIYSADSTALPDGLTAETGWVINGDRVWDASFEIQEGVQPKPYELERVARNGPKWGPDIEVETVVRLREADGSTHLLRASKQSIGRTD